MVGGRGGAGGCRGEAGEDADSGLSAVVSGLAFAPGVMGPDGGP